MPLFTYLDHAATTEYTDEQIQAFLNDLTLNRFGNPHSLNSRGLLTSSRVDQMRQKILNHFGTTSEHYAVVFTSNCSAALKIVAESFNWSPKSVGSGPLFNNTWYQSVRMGEPCFIYLQDNHTSVVGMRVHAFMQNVAVYAVDEKALTSTNFCGRRYPLKWCSLGPQRWYTCLDAAALAPTCQFSLGANGPDFVTISFYKMFGFPTGIGALLVLRKSAHVLQRPYFGGGTPRDEIEKRQFQKYFFLLRFEDGTLAYQLVIALKHGFDAIEKAGGIARIGQRVFQLANRAYDGLLSLRHYNGSKVAHIYCESKFRSPLEQGGTVAFNLLRSDGRWVGFSEVDRMAGAYDIQLRTGCFCNQGACQLALGLTDSQEGIKRCGDQVDVLNGHPLGAVRISFGWTSVEDDVSRFLSFIEECFVEKAPLEKLRFEWNGEELLKRVFKLEKIFVYPVKSCRPVEVADHWPISNYGLWLDRKWMVVDSYGVAVKLENNAAISKVRLSIDLSKLWLFDDQKAKRTCEASDCGEDVAIWLDEVLKTKGTRLVHSSGPSDHGLNNQAQYLMVNRASVQRLLEEMQEDPELIARFRPNLVIEGAEPFEEETWNQVKIGSTLFNCIGKCQRCAVIAVNPENGAKTPEVLKHLHTLSGSEFTFGIYLKLEDQQNLTGGLLRIGDPVYGIV
ncbi:molybdenum cofactor sulfurase [Trichuris trichiura]|uniref:Molybdenum cofactor sulfurase n=1 Tax=Trichuris trichiura TaxID=36087 RepID=A0A077ZAG6_TRITR|nr:molybdenum cofactor sulfurase [Trichuris trichiura]